MRGARSLAPKSTPRNSILVGVSNFQLRINGGYDDNVILTPNGSPSWFANPNANLSYQFGSARLAMDLLTGGGINYYFDHPGGLNYDPIVSLELSLAYKVTPRLTLDFSTVIILRSPARLYYRAQLNSPAGKLHSFGKSTVRSLQIVT